MNVRPSFTPATSPAEAAAIVVSGWQRDYLTPDWHRSRARVCWREAQMIARYIVSHGWLMNSDQIESLQDERRDLRKSAAAHAHTARLAS